jgi:hypothetical protein
LFEMPESEEAGRWRREEKEMRDAGVAIIKESCLAREKRSQKKLSATRRSGA